MDEKPTDRQTETERGQDERASGILEDFKKIREDAIAGLVERENRARWGRGEPVPEIKETNCPFYGRHLAMVGRPFVLLDQHGNECALMVTGYHPCLYTRVEEIDWRTCPVVAEVRIGLELPKR